MEGRGHGMPPWEVDLLFSGAGSLLTGLPHAARRAPDEQRFSQSDGLIEELEVHVDPQVSQGWVIHGCFEKIPAVLGLLEVRDWENAGPTPHHHAGEKGPA